MSVVLAYLLWARDFMFSDPRVNLAYMHRGCPHADVETKAQRCPLARVTKFTGTEQGLGRKSVLQAPVLPFPLPPGPGDPGRRRFRLLFLISASVDSPLG